MKEGSDQICAAIEQMHNCLARLREAVQLTERFGEHVARLRPPVSPGERIAWIEPALFEGASCE